VLPKLRTEAQTACVDAAEVSAGAAVSHRSTTPKALTPRAVSR